MKILLIDNYDSFTYNLLHYMQELGADVQVVRNDEMSADDVAASGVSGILISPGPCSPDEAGICLDVVRKCSGVLPIFGVCLGHQVIGQAFGGSIIRAPYPMHGKVSEVEHNSHPMFAQIPGTFEATRYHSLVIDEASMPDYLEITAHNKISDPRDGRLVMAVAHREHKTYGVQFHPESIASQYGHKLLANFLEVCRIRPLPS